MKSATALTKKSMKKTILATTISGLIALSANAATIVVTGTNDGVTGVSVDPNSTSFTTNATRLIAGDEPLSGVDVTYQITNYDYFGDGTANDSITVTLNISGTSSASDQFLRPGGGGNGFGIGASGATAAATQLQDDDGDTMTFTFVSLSATWGSGQTDIATWNGFTGTTVVAMANGESFDLSGDTDSANYGGSGDNGNVVDVPVDTVDGINDQMVIDNIVTTNGILPRDLIFEIDVAAVPEPSSTALLGLGGLAFILRRRK